MGDIKIAVTLRFRNGTAYAFDICGFDGSLFTQLSNPFSRIHVLGRCPLVPHSARSSHKTSVSELNEVRVNGLPDRALQPTVCLGCGQRLPTTLPNPRQITLQFLVPPVTGRNR